MNRAMSDNLEERVAELEKLVSTLTSHIEELNDRISNICRSAARKPTVYGGPVRQQRGALRPKGG